MTDISRTGPVPLGIIAGLGDLPVEVAERARAQGREIFVVRLQGFEEPRLEGFPGVVLGIGQVGKTVSAFKAAGVREVVFAGNVKRPDFAQLKLDLKGASLLPSVLKAARSGDDALLRVMVKAYEKEGFRVVGSEEIADGLVQSAGFLTRREASETDRADVERAAFVAAEIGRLDIGQGCVVCDGLVLAVEAQEGTDAMLRRVAELPEEIRGRQDSRRGVLVKRPKPIQERRIDLPTIGRQTVELAAAAGLAGIAVEAGGALILNRDEVIRMAEDAAMFVWVFDSELGRVP